MCVPRENEGWKGGVKPWALGSAGALSNWHLTIRAKLTGITLASALSMITLHYHAFICSHWKGWLKQRARDDLLLDRRRLPWKEAGNNREPCWRAKAGMPGTEARGMSECIETACLNGCRLLCRFLIIQYWLLSITEQLQCCSEDPKIHWISFLFFLPIKDDERIL